MSSIRVIGAALGLATAVSASGQCGPEWAQDGPVDEGFYGWGTVNLGDLDGDGNEEIVSQFNMTDSSEVTGHVFSSALDGRVIQICNFCGYLGFTGMPLGDTEGDGIAEWLRHQSSGTGVEVVSGFDTVVWHYSGDELGSASCGDLDGDGIVDFAIGDPWPGTTTIYSGATRAVIGELSGVVSRGLGLGDLSGDGANDFVVKIGLSGIHVHSGADLTKLYSILGQGRLGDSMSGVGDVDGDGAADFVIADPFYQAGGTTVGRAVLVSGATGSFLVDEAGTAIEPIKWTTPAGDWNLDGVLDIVMSSPDASYNGPGSGRASFRSGDDLRVIDRIDGAGQLYSLRATQALIEGLPGQDRPAIVIAEPGYNNRVGRISLYMSRCRADFNCDDAVNTMDVLAFLNAFAAGELSADVNFDDVVNTQDVLAFLNIWNEGC